MDHDDSPWKPSADGADEAPVAPSANDGGAPSVDEPAPSPWAPGSTAEFVPATPTIPTPAAPPATPAPVPPPPAAGTATALVTPPPPPGAVPGAPAPMATPGEWAPGQSGPGESAPKYSKWLVGGAIASVLAVGGAGIFAVSSLTGSTAGGADSPDALGLELLAAVENEDLLGAIDVLLPGERETLGDPFIELVGELSRLGVLADVDLGNISGLDIELDRESVQVRSTNVDDIVNIDLRADATVSVDGAALPIGDLILDNLPPEAVTEVRGSRITQTEELDISLTAVLDDDGQWYFSLWHTVAELGRQEAAPGEGIPATGVGSDGADSAEAAVDQLLDRVEALDLTGIIRTLDPAEAAALQRYAPLFLEEAEAALDEVPLVWQITERSIRVEGEGDGRTAFVDALAIEGDVDGLSFSVSFSGDCLSADFDGDSFEQCGSGFGDGTEIDEMLSEAPAAAHLFELIEEAFADIEPAGIELRQRDDGWYVSPVTTVTEALLKAFRALDRDELDGIVEAAPPAIEEFIDLFFGGFTFDPVFPDDQPVTIDDLVEPSDPFDIVDDDVDTGEPGDPTVAEPDHYQCWDLRDSTAASDCFLSFVAAGELELWEVPVELRFPECGYAEASWTGALYSMSDEEFIATAEAARGCFLEKLAAGEVEEWELPAEITYLECFEGRNWYNVYDEAYEDRYWACIEESYGRGVGD